MGEKIFVIYCKEHVIVKQNLHMCKSDHRGELTSIAKGLISNKEALHNVSGNNNKKGNTLQWLSVRKILSLKDFAVPSVPDGQVCSSWKKFANLSPLVFKFLVRIYQNLILLLAPRLLLDCRV